MSAKGYEARVCLTGGAPTPPGVVVSAQNGLLEARTKKQQPWTNPTRTTHHDLINLLLQDGLGEGLPKIAELLMNAAMLMERAKHIGAGPYERVEARNGHANGFKPRSFHTLMGALNLATPLVRGSDIPFRTSLLEKGSRSDRALKAAISSIYLQGVSTRRIFNAEDRAHAEAKLADCLQACTKSAPKLATWAE